MTEFSYSSTPQVMDKLVNLWTAGFADPGDVKVVDAATGEPQFRVAALAVGVQNDEDGTPSAEGQTSIENWQGMTERYSITNTLSVLTGAAGYRAARTSVFAYLAQARAFLAANPTLDGLVLTAAVGTWSLIEARISKGQVARIVFAIDIEALEVVGSG